MGVAMKVFVAGATGAIGRPAVRQLVAAGHEVTGMTRSEERMEEIRAAGATPVRCNVLQAQETHKALHQAQPEVVVHLLTALPPRLDYRAKEDPLAPTNRLRREGTRNLLAAAKAAGAQRLVAESVAFFYAPEGDRVKDEAAPLLRDAPGVFGPAAKALADLEAQVSGAEGIEGVVLRYGWLYGPGTYFARDGSQTEDALKRRLPIVGRGEGTFSFVHVEDAAAATLAAAERAAPGTSNVVDDEPVPMREWVPAFCEAVGAKKPRRVPTWLARLLAGSAAASTATQLRGASNAKARRELGWQPRYPSWRQGFADPVARG
jgi:nucleoside-diphosphate-sugar epimerase